MGGISAVGTASLLGLVVACFCLYKSKLDFLLEIYWENSNDCVHN